MTLNQKRAVFFASLFVGIGLVAFLIIRLAQGYKPDISTRTLRPTGLLVATSDPDGAQLVVDGKLKSATNTTLNLAPDIYEVEIKKDGFFPWKKVLTLKRELVTKAEASLFSSFPDLNVLTFTGAADPALSPDGQKVVFSVATASASKKGTWVLDLTDRPLGFNREPRQILQSATSPTGVSRDFSQASYEWSPDSKQILVTLGKEGFLVDANRINPDTGLVNISQTIPVLKNRWREEETVKNEAKISKLPEKLLGALDQAVQNLSFSPDETKIFYEATASAAIPENITPQLPTASTQKESRSIENGKQYVYDLKEDRNFEITAPENTQISWFPSSRHLFAVQEDKISVVEYDNQNWTDIYTGPFVNSFAFPFPSGTKLLILTSIGKDTPANLYAISLK